MRTTTRRRRGTALSAAATAALDLAACGPESAPGITAPSVAPSVVPTSSSSSSAPSSSSSSPSSRPSPSGASQSAAGAVCNTTSTIGPVFPDQVSAKPFGTTGQAQNGYSTPSTLQVAPQKPRALPSPSNSYELDPSMQYVGVDLRTHLLSGSMFFVSHIEFNLFDAQRHACTRTSYTTVISGGRLLRTTSLNATTKDANGTLVFRGAYRNGPEFPHSCFRCGHQLHAGPRVEGLTPSL